jgi:hypothetical protein
VWVGFEAVTLLMCIAFRDLGGAIARFVIMRC